MLWSMPRFFNDVREEVLNSIRANGTHLIVEMAESHFKEQGKMVRPRIAYDLGKALSANYQSCVSWAACIEMLHNAALIHDDLQDGDLLRRDRPTIWSQYGAVQAINLGDFLLLLAPRLVLQSNCNPTHKLALCELYSKISTEIVNGQSFEPTLKESLSKSHLLADYLNCISQKTSSLFSGVAEGICLFASTSKQERISIQTCFKKLGDLFQIQDDILDLYGDKKRSQAGCDIKEGKVSFLVAKHLAHFPEDLNVLSNILLKPRNLTSDEEVKVLIAMFKEKNTLGMALNFILQLKHEILTCSSVETKPIFESVLEEVLNPIRHLWVGAPGDRS